MKVMNTTPSAPHFSRSNDDITTESYSLFIPYNIFGDIIDGNDRIINANSTLNPLNEYIS